MVYVIRTFGGVFAITWAPVVPATPNVTFYLRSGYALMKARGA